MDEKLCDNKEECPICLEELNSNNSKVLVCKHSFHKLCIDTWLERKNICPLCRFPLDTTYKCWNERHRFIKYKIKINEDHVIFKHCFYKRTYNYKKIKSISYNLNYFSVQYLEDNKIIVKKYVFKNEYICEKFFKTIKSKFI